MTHEVLIRRCQGGDNEAFESLLESYYDTIYRFAYRWCRDQANAQDITQLVCIKLAKSIAQFNFESSFNSWLYSLVINCAKDFYKSPKQHNTRERQEENLDLLAGSSNDQSAQRLYAQQILEHIGNLQEDLRDTLILVYGTGLNHRQAAQKLQVKESTVSWRIHEARKILKHTFNSSDINHEESRGLA